MCRYVGTRETRSLISWMEREDVSNDERSAGDPAEASYSRARREGWGRPLMAAGRSYVASVDDRRVFRCQFAVRALLQFVLHTLAFIEAPEPGTLNCRDVDKGVLRAIVRSDEAEASRGVEELDSSFGHRFLNRHVAPAQHVARWVSTS